MHMQLCKPMSLFHYVLESIANTGLIGDVFVPFLDRHHLHISAANQLSVRFRSQSILDHSCTPYTNVLCFYTKKS